MCIRRPWTCSGCVFNLSGRGCAPCTTRTRSALVTLALIDHHSASLALRARWLAASGSLRAPCGVARSSARPPAGREDAAGFLLGMRSDRLARHLLFPAGQVPRQPRPVLRGYCRVCSRARPRGRSLWRGGAGWSWPWPCSGLGWGWGWGVRSFDPALSGQNFPQLQHHKKNAFQVLREAQPYTVWEGEGVGAAWVIWPLFGSVYLP